MHKHILCDTFQSQLLHVYDNHLYFIFKKRKWFLTLFTFENFYQFYTLLYSSLPDRILGSLLDLNICTCILACMMIIKKNFFFLRKLVVKCITNLTRSACDKYSVVLIQYKYTLYFEKCLIENVYAYMME